MKLRQPYSDKNRAAPFERRLAGWFSLLLFVLAMAGQATHTHGLLRAGVTIQAASESPATELNGSELTADSCPLCVAMSSAQAASVVSAPLHVGGLQAALAPGKARFQPSRPGRSYQSRPPPIS